MKKCLNCGEENLDESKFCNACGSPLNANLNPDADKQTNNQQYNNNPNLDNQQMGNNVDFNYQQRTNPNFNNQQGNNSNFNNQQRNNPNFNNHPNNNQSLTEKISNLSTPQKVIGIIALCCIGILILAAIAGNSSDRGSLPSNSSYSSSSGSSYSDSSSGSSLASKFNKSDCKEISYNELEKNPDKYYGENLKLSGKVFQISEGGSSGNFLMMYVGGEYEFDQVLYVEYSNDTNIVKDDWVTVYGVCEGSYSYSTRIGGSNTVPSLYAVDLVKS